MLSGLVACGDKEPPVEVYDRGLGAATCEDGGEGCLCEHPNTVDNPVGYYLTGFHTKGTYPGSTDPEAIAMVHIEGGAAGSGAHLDSEHLAPGAGPEWDITGEWDSVTGYDIACANDTCDGYYATELVDVAGACLGAQATEASLEFSSAASGPGAPTPPPSCTSGSGSFRMMIRDWMDSDDDGTAIGRLVPFMTSGTGHMDKHAWVTRIEVLSSDVDTLRVVHVGHGTRLEDDALVDAGTISTVLTGSTSFSSGTVVGRPAVVAEGWDSSGGVDVVLEMDWTCHTEDVPFINQPSGFRFSLDDLGCPWVQEMIVRPLPHQLRWQAFGDASDEWRTPTTLDAWGNQEFELTYGSFAASGEVTSITPQAMTVVFDSFTLSGLPVCSTGTYTFPHE